MRRVEGAFWPDFENHLIRCGLLYNETTLDDGSIKSYWRDGAYYEFDKAELDQIEQDANKLYQMLIPAADWLIETGRLGKMGIPEWAWDTVIDSWNRLGGLGDPAVYGRFDFRYGGNSPLALEDPSLARIKMLEYNADTPTSILESAIVQWQWYLFMCQGDHTVGQWNELEEKLVLVWKRKLDEAFGALRRKYGPNVNIPQLVHFACSSYPETRKEDLGNTRVLEEYARSAGYDTELMYVEDIQHGMADDMFLDTKDRDIRVIFKLHAWEWMCSDRYISQKHEQFGKAAVRSVRNGTVQWIEPIWKMLWSNKAILAALWAVGRDDPEVKDLLLPAYFEDEAPEDLGPFVRKPLLAREGANIAIIDDDGKLIEAGKDQEYGADGYIVQQFAPLPNFHSKLDGDHHPVLGVWTAEDEAAGLGIRESDGLITNDLSSFVPHVFKI